MVLSYRCFLRSSMPCYFSLPFQSLCIQVPLSYPGYIFFVHMPFVFSCVPRVKSGQCRCQQLKALTCTYGKDRYNPGKWMSWIAFRCSGCFSQASTVLFLFGPIVAGCVTLIIWAPLKSYTPLLVWEPFFVTERSDWIYHGCYYSTGSNLRDKPKWNWMGAICEMKENPHLSDKPIFITLTKRQKRNMLTLK